MRFDRDTLHARRIAERELAVYSGVEVTAGGLLRGTEPALVLVQSRVKSATKCRKCSGDYRVKLSYD